MGSDFEMFLQKMKEEILIKGNGRVTVRDARVRKNNGIVCTGFSIVERDDKPAPTIYMEAFYAYYMQGVEMDKLVDQVWMIYEQNVDKGMFSIREFEQFELAKKRILYKVVNAKKNKDLLNEVPHIMFLDLAIVFYYLMDDASILIRNEHMENWESNLNELFRIAKKNTPEILPFELRNITDLMNELLEHEIRKDLENVAEMESGREEACVKDIIQQIESTQGKWKNDPSVASTMYVLSNKRKFLGAACILYPDIMKCFAKLINRDFYILPSSIHEVILLPVQRDCDPVSLKNMVMEVNQSEVEEGEYLSDSVYYYDRLKSKLTICM